MKFNQLLLIFLVTAVSAELNGQYQRIVPPDPLEYPDPLTTIDGQNILSSSSWEKNRRAEILELFKENVYGNLPSDYDSINFKSLENKKVNIGVEVIFKKIQITVFRNSKAISFNTLIYLPGKIQNPVPAFVLINHRPVTSEDPEKALIEEFWPADKIVGNGFAAIMFDANQLSPDNKENYSDGVIGSLYPEELNKNDGMMTISAWAWGASRVMDYIETEELIDDNKVAVIGHSRGGKTALWCGANDERFKLVISNNSGNTGAALSRRPVGEQVSNINEFFPYWFCENYKKYNFKVKDLPVDQHMLISLIAPRGIYVASASEDEWADPLGEFFSLNMAVPVYKLYFNSATELNYPTDNNTIHSGQMAYHIRKGGHGLMLSDWEKYMVFFRELE